MSIAPISSSGFSNTTAAQSIHNNIRTFQQGFGQPGVDQGGNSSSALQEFASLGVTPQSNSTSNSASSPGSTTSGPTPVVASILNTFQNLGQDLQSGNTTAAKQDYNTLKQDFQTVASNSTHGHDHPSAKFKEEFSQLGDALQTGNASLAQASYSALLTDVQQASLGVDPAAALAPSLTSSISATA